MNVRQTLALASALAFGAVFTAEAQVFKCKDAEGKVTYTDVPCLRSESESVVDTRANVADHGSLRKEAARLPRGEPAAAPRQAEAPSPAPPPAAPSARSNVRSGY